LIRHPLIIAPIGAQRQGLLTERLLLAYNLKRIISILGVRPLLEAITA
jgi:hypothetical protein